MIEKIFATFCLLIVAATCHTQSTDSIDAEMALRWSIEDSLINTLDFKDGEVKLKDDLATINVPKGFKYLDAKDAHTVLVDLWHNPEDLSSLGLLVPDYFSVFGDSSWAIDISYSDEGYIKDDDADEIDYDDLLKEMRKDFAEANIERKANNYSTAELIGWASPPYYDKQNHKLHWAKEIKFDNDSLHTLNYNIRILGREGVLVLNAIATIGQLKLVQKNLDGVLAGVNFNAGKDYKSFDSSTDKIAAYGIGGLIAGKVLAKVGFFAVILKSWKLIALAIAGFGAMLKNKIFGKKSGDDSA